MKKIEAEQIAPNRAIVLLEYVQQILSDPSRVNSKIDFEKHTIDGEIMCTAEVYVFKDHFERHLNMGITFQHCNVLYEHFLSNILSAYLKHETIGITKFIHLHHMFGENFYGIEITNEIGSVIKVNFKNVQPGFSDIVLRYESVIDKYVEAITNLQEENGKSK